MEPTVLPAQALAVPPSVPPAYPTLRESWTFVGWYVLAGLVAGSASYAVVRTCTTWPTAIAGLVGGVVGNVGLLYFLRWKAGARWPRWQWAGQARGWQFALLPGVVVAAQLLLSPLDWLHLPDVTAPVFRKVSETPALALLLGAGAVPILEELLFRGVVLNGLLRSQRPWVAIGQSALVFGLIHFNPAQSVSAAALGLLLGWLYYRTRSLGLCILLHAINNGLGFVAMHWGPASWQHADTIAELFPSAAYYAGALGLSVVGLWAYVRGVAGSTQVAGISEAEE